MTLSGSKPGQHDEELEPFIELLKLENVRSYLEIGARQGDTFYRVVTALGPGAGGVAVDLPGGPWGKPGTDAPLKRCCDELKREGHDVIAAFGDVADVAFRAAIKALGRPTAFHTYPYDALFIDADHRYESVRRDWENFRDFARIVAFHDIAAGGAVQRAQGYVAGVERLWREIRDELGETARFAEFVHPDPARPMGIGVVLR